MKHSTPPSAADDLLSLKHHLFLFIPTHSSLLSTKVLTMFLVLWTESKCSTKVQLMKTEQRLLEEDDSSLREGNQTSITALCYMLRQPSTIYQVKLEQYPHQNVLKVPKVAALVLQNGPFQNNMYCLF